MLQDGQAGERGQIAHLGVPAVELLQGGQAGELSYDEDAVWEMMSKNRVAAYGDQKSAVDYLHVGDIVFFSHKGYGIIAAGEVVGRATDDDGQDERFRKISFLTPTPKKDVGITKYMSFSDVSSVTGKTFFWARIIKVPYLKIEEGNKLLEELKLKLLLSSLLDAILSRGERGPGGFKRTVRSTYHKIG
jgi:hypothetical protein